jgi:serine/threonine protein kinase
MNRSFESAAGILEGDILAGKYRVERVLGAGSMGVVVAAHHMQLDEKVALKFSCRRHSTTERPWPALLGKRGPR